MLCTSSTSGTGLELSEVEKLSRCAAREHSNVSEVEFC